MRGPPELTFPVGLRMRTPIDWALCENFDWPMAQLLIRTGGGNSTEVLEALDAAAAAAPIDAELVQAGALFADVAASPPLSEDDWGLVPAQAPGLAAALPAVLARSRQEAAHLVHRLPPVRIGNGALDLGSVWWLAGPGCTCMGWVSSTADLASCCCLLCQSCPCTLPTLSTSARRTTRGACKPSCCPCPMPAGWPTWSCPMTCWPPCWRLCLEPSDVQLSCIAGAAHPAGRRVRSQVMWSAAAPLRYRHPRPATRKHLLRLPSPSSLA